MHRFKNSFRSFLRDEDGVVLAEALLIIPFLIWTMVALFVYWDVWRTINIGQKAAYSVADLLSRQEDPIEPSYLANMQNILNFLTPGAPQRAMRITSFEFDEGNNEYCLLFSTSTNETAAPKKTKTQIQDWRTDGRIPTLVDRESVFVVETWVDFTPAFDTGVLNIGPTLNAATYGEFVVTSPRHRRLVLVGNTNCL